jgi:hypothetical protein
LPQGRACTRTVPGRSRVKDWPIFRIWSWGSPGWVSQRVPVVHSTRVPGSIIYLPMSNWRDGFRWGYFLLVGGILLAAGCALIPQPTPAAWNYQTPIPLETVQAYRPTYPITDVQQVVIAAQIRLSAPHWNPVGEQQVLSVEKLPLGEAHRRVDPPGSINYEQRPADMLVWLVVFRGYTQISPPDPLHTITPYAPQLGCSYVLLVPDQFSGRQTGGIACPPDLPPWVDPTATPLPTRTLIPTASPYQPPTNISPMMTPYPYPVPGSPTNIPPDAYPAPASGVIRPAYP